MHATLPRFPLASILIAGALAGGCIPVFPDCDPSATRSPIAVYIGAPAGIPASAFTATAIGSRGDRPSLQGPTGSGLVFFSGSGASDETYQVTVTYGSTVIFDGNVGWSVDGCGFVVNVDYPECCLDGGAAPPDGGADSGS